MLTPQRLQIGRAPIHGVLIQRPRAAGELRAELPHEIAGEAGFAEDGVLPGPGDADAVLGLGHGVLLEHDGLAEALADFVVLRDPRVAPGVVVAPLVGVHVHGAEVDGADREVLLEVDAVVARVRVAVVVVGDVGRRLGEPAFVAEGDEVVRVEGLDVGGGVGGPFGDDAAGAARAVRLVAELPAEHGGALLIAVDDEFDVVLEGGLGGGMGVKAVVGTAVGVGIGVNAAEVIPIVEEDKDQLDVVFLGRCDGVVEAGDTIGGVVVEVLARGIEDLIVDLLCVCAGVVGCAEAPDPEYFVAGLVKTSEGETWAVQVHTAAIWEIAVSTSAFEGRCPSHQVLVPGSCQQSRLELGRWTNQQSIESCHRFGTAFHQPKESMLL